MKTGNRLEDLVFIVCNDIEFSFHPHVQNCPEANLMGTDDFVSEVEDPEHETDHPLIADHGVSR
jgi:hypothetical protein